MNTLNPDTFRRLCVQLDEKALYSLGRGMSGQWIMSAITTLLNDNRFWYERTEYIANKKLSYNQDDNWVKIYNIVDRTLTASVGSTLEHNKRTIFSWMYILGLKYLPALKTLVEIYGEPSPMSASRALEMQPLAIESVDVLMYILDKGWIEYDSEVTMSHLYELIETKDDGEIVAALLSILKKTQVTKEELQYLPDQVVRYGRHTTLKLLLEAYTFDDTITTRALKTAIKDGRANVVEVLLKKRSYELYVLRDMLPIVASNTRILRLLVDGIDFDSSENQSITNEIFYIAVQNGNVDSARLLIDLIPRLRSRITREMLLNSISAGRTEFVSFLLEYINPYSESNEVLMVAKRVNMLELLLRDSRVDPMLNLESVVLSMITRPRESNVANLIKITADRVKNATSLTSDGHLRAEKRVNTLVLDSRVKIEELSVQLIRILCWASDDLLQDRIEGYIEGGMLASEVKSTRERMGLAIEEDSIYGHVLAFIALKRPSSIDLVKWMQEMNNRDLVLAARNAIGEEETKREELVPLQALMTCLLYPLISLEDILDELRVNEENEDSIRRAGELVGTYLGKIGIEQRRKTLK